MATHKPVLIDELYGELAVSDTLGKWNVIHTKPQCEKKLAAYLQRNGLFYYLPQMDSVRLYQYRKVTFTKPMFPGYLFSRFGTADKTTVLLSGCAVGFLKVPNERELLDELLQIHTGRSLQAELTEGTWLESGWLVEIISGPMQGLRGVVQSQEKLSEVTLQVNILRQAVSLRVNPAEVRLLNEYGYS